ncbi:MAG: hypothetical protein PVF27_08395, partial [Gemmatimonadales bacterium]
MKRHFFGMAGSLAVLLLVAGCLDDPTAALRGGVERVLIERTYAELDAGGEITVNASAYDAQGNALGTLPSVSSADPAIATVTVDTVVSGDPLPRTTFTIVGVGYGTTSIIAEAGGMADTTTVVVFPASLDISGLAATVGSGASLSLTAQFFDADGEALTPLTGAEPIEWSSSNSARLEVDQDGNATAKSVGDVEICIELRNGTEGCVETTVVPGTFNGTLSSATGTSGGLFTVTRAGGGPAFDADTRVSIGGVGAFIDSRTDDAIVVFVPYASADMSDLLIENYGPDQLAQVAAFTGTAVAEDGYAPGNYGPPGTDFAANATANDNLYVAQQGASDLYGGSDPSDWMFF